MDNNGNSKDARQRMFERMRQDGRTEKEPEQEKKAEQFADTHTDEIVGTAAESRKRMIDNWKGGATNND